MPRKSQAKGPAWPADAVERWSIDKLKPNPRNARTHSADQIKQIVAAIREWGWTIPILAQANGLIIAGHGRYEAALQMGIAEVPVMVARNWSDAQVRAYMLADNQIALNAGWDEELLKLELIELRDDGVDVALMGFDDAEIAEMLAPAAAPNEFQAFGEDIEIEHKCPKCGYGWSGKAA